MDNPLKRLLLHFWYKHTHTNIYEQIFPVIHSGTAPYGGPFSHILSASGGMASARARGGKFARQQGFALFCHR